MLGGGNFPTGPTVVIQSCGLFSDYVSKLKSRIIAPIESRYFTHISYDFTVIHLL